MNEQHIEDIISALYDMIQDARALPLGADKCILERDKVLDMLDEIIAQLPAELKQSRTIVESRNELIGQARREAETILREAQEKAKEMVTKEAIYIEAKKPKPHEERVGAPGCQHPLPVPGMKHLGHLAQTSLQKAAAPRAT